MRRNTRCPQPPRPEVLAPRRGNSIVLVMGILVLLVIIATAFITRTHAGRVTSSVMVRTMLRDDNARAMAEMLAQEISMALFPRPVDPNDPEVFAGRVADSNYPRLSPRRNPIRYGVDQDNDGPDGVPFSGDDDGNPDHPYAFAPYTVVAFTNWPDPIAIDPSTHNWPRNPGGVVGQNILALSGVGGEGNPIGNPGFGDARWLADIEPLRWVSPGLDGILGTPDDFEAFSHWRHMTNIAHANNGFRIVVGIHDVGDLNGDGLGQLVTGLADPVEQWLAVKPLEALIDLTPIFNRVTGNAVFRNSDDFGTRWLNWFSLGGLNYAQTYLDPTLVPPNFYDLGDLDGNGVAFDHLAGDLPQDEFVAGSARHAVSSILADTDGDGFTDSFWYLAPTMTERGIRQIVAVRIIDNSAMLNANVATRFVINDVLFGIESKTRGATPADLALVGENNTDPFTVPSDTWNVGFFDNHANWEGNPPPPDGDGSIFFPGFLGSADAPDSPYGTSVVRYRDVRWGNDGKRDFLSEIGVDGNPIFFGNPELERADGRLTYWRLAGLRPFSATGGLTPFTLADELALRMFHGQNYPWIISRFERAVNTTSNDNAFLRSSIGREESSEYLDQCSNRELLFDSRRKLTLFNGARNDQMPPWLWLFASPNADNNDDLVIDGLDFDLWLDGARKFDLRLPPVDLDNDGVVVDDFDGDGDLELDPDDVRLLGENLRDRLERALVDITDESYYGSGGANLIRTHRLAASLAANILAYRDLHDPNDDARLAEAVAVVGVEGPDIEPLFPRFLGLERQPFLLEAFIGHVHASAPIPQIPGDDPPPPQYFGHPGNYVNDSHEQSTIVVVQIANPFDEPVDLSRYKLRVFGQMIDLTGIPDLPLLPAASEKNPATAIFYAIDEAFEHDSLGLITDFRAKWRDFLDIEPGDHPTGPAGTIFKDVTTLLSTAREDYVSLPAGQNAIELLRIDTSLPMPHDVVIDRFDYDASHSLHGRFRDAVADLVEPPDPFQNPFANPPLLAGVRIGTDHYWVTWARVTRAWGRDIDNSGTITADEKAPRYVFAHQRVSAADTQFIGDANDGDSGPDDSCGYCGDSYSNDDAPDLPWFEKPTLFAMNDAVTTGYPDKGVYYFSNSLQMLQKDRDFEQVGELLNVWLFGHELGFDVAGDYQQTTKTFSEYMADSSMAGTGPRVNRLRVRPTGTTSPIIGKGDPMNLLDPLHAVPALPAGLRVLDAFVCDDRGVNGTMGVDEFLNANGFTGKITPGLINVNTAPPEVLRSAPHMTRLVHEIGSPSFNPFVRVPEAIVQYRERFGDPMVNTDLLPAYGDRGDNTFIKDLRGERGIASIGEIGLLNRLADGFPPLEPDPDLYKRSFRADFAGLDPFGFDFAGQPIESTQISTDVNDVFDPNLPGDAPDDVAKDVEELNLLFAGMSNMLTTRSDVFTVYFRVRSFIQNPTTGVWDATNPEFIVDDSRYVMLVDRSEVNHPNDKPKILYLEKLPK